MVMYYFGQLRLGSFFQRLTFHNYVRVVRDGRIRCFFQFPVSLVHFILLMLIGGFLLVLLAVSFFSELHIFFLV